jgi:hypothetical protein
MGETYTPLCIWNMASMCKNLPGKSEDREASRRFKSRMKFNITIDKETSTAALSSGGPL